MLAKRQALMRAIADAQRSIDEAARLVDPDWPKALQWQLLSSRAFAFGASGQHGPASALWEELASQQEAVGDREGMLTSLMNAADLGYKFDFEAAVRLAYKVVELMRSERYRGLAAGFARANLSGALTQQGRQLDEALALGREAVPFLIQSGALGLFLDHFGLLALKRGRVADAARVLGRAAMSSAQRGVAREGHEQRSHDAATAGLRAALTVGELERLMQEGVALSDEAAARLALGA
jgi:hypothetical protein